MTPLTPLIETPNGRLAELISLITDAPLHLTFDAVTESDTAVPSQHGDPWWVVAGAIVRLRSAEEGFTHLPGLPDDICASDFGDFNTDEEVLSDVLSGLIDLAAV